MFTISILTINSNRIVKSAIIDSSIQNYHSPIIKKNHYDYIRQEENLNNELTEVEVVDNLSNSHFTPNSNDKTEENGLIRENYINLTSNFKSLTKYLDLKIEFPYTCGTWFNRGKNICNFIKESLENSGYNVSSHIYPFKANDSSENRDGFFNIFIKKNEKYILIATSNEKNDKYHKGLKFFAYTFYEVDKKTGEPNYSNDYPYKNDLLQYVVDNVNKAYSN